MAIRRVGAHHSRVPCRALAILPAFFVAACVGGEPIEVAAKRPPTHGTARVRVVLRAPELFGHDLSDAKCTMSNKDFTAYFNGNATLDVPLYGYGTQPLDISCTKAGYRATPQTVKPFDADLFQSAKSKAMASQIAGSLLGVVPGVGWAIAPVGRSVGAAAGVQAALDEYKDLPEAERRAHNYSYMPALTDQAIMVDFAVAP